MSDTPDEKVIDLSSVRAERSGEPTVVPSEVMLRAIADKIEAKEIEVEQSIVILKLKESDKNQYPLAHACNGGLKSDVLAMLDVTKAFLIRQILGF